MLGIDNATDTRSLLAKYSKARRIRPLSEVYKADHRYRQTPTPAPRPMKVGVTMQDGKKMLFWTDGSLRHRDPRNTAPGKAAGKRIKKARARANGGRL